MELSVREWIMVGSVVVIAAILAHALWVRWRARRSRLRLEIDPKATTAVGDVDDLDLLRGELPNGGARVLPDGDPRPASSKAGGKAAGKSGAGPSVGGGRDRSAAARDDGTAPPVLLDTVGTARRVEPRLDDSSDDDDVEAPQRDDAERISADRGNVDRGSADRGNVDRVSADRANAGQQELLVMQVLARDSEGFDVGQVMNRATQAGMKFGDFNIFHRYKDGRPSRKAIEYSMANAVEPGVFDLSAGAASRTRGVAFFMQLPTPSEPMEVFDDMLRIAQDIASGLDGELRDERHGPMTVQTIEHCRERIREFTRRQQIPG